MPTELYLVLCLNPSHDTYEAATRRLFDSLAEAAMYRATINESYHPLLVQVLQPVDFRLPRCARCGALSIRGTCGRHCDE